MAESAARSGARVVAVDFFGDRDQARAATSYALGRDLGLPLTAEGLARAASRLDAGAVVYGANLENHPAAVARLGRRHALLGNEAPVVRQVRDWRVLRRFCADAGIACPTTLVAGEEGYARQKGGRWLRKRVRSGGGHGVRRWDGAPLDRSHLLQAEITGRAASASFVADGHAAQVFGLGEQLIGDKALGARGFAWCGNIAPFPAGGARGRGLAEAVADMASLLTRRFGLRGVNGLDLVVAEGPGGALVPYLVEVNPRVTASMELAERAHGVNVFTLHLAGCAGRPPGGHPAERQTAGFSADAARAAAVVDAPPAVVAIADAPPAVALPAAGPGPFFGKAVVFARRAVVTPDTDAWLEESLACDPVRAGGSDTRAVCAAPGRPAVRDVPGSGEPIAAGHPVCTVFADGAPDRDACLAALHQAAATMYGRLRHGGRRREVRRERETHADQRSHA
jgi:predicted ATP-grasp superfamily ATP-dependent carboligase